MSISSADSGEESKQEEISTVTNPFLPNQQAVFPVPPAKSFLVSLAFAFDTLQVLEEGNMLQQVSVQVQAGGGDATEEAAELEAR